MKIDVKTWDEYIGRLRRINKRAATEMEALLNRLKALPTLERREETIVDYAFKLATRYGEAAGAAACEMYDAIASASGRNVPPADPADTATFSETAKAIRGTIKNQSENAVPSTVGRLVKQVGADTMLQNAARDGAEFAWVPHGDTCPFCIMLASNGWLRVSKKTLRRGHAEHIHANCDCMYAVRFSERDGVAGYDPDQYKKIYDNADGYNWKQKLRSMEHDRYEAHKDERNARRRELYAQRKALQSAVKNDTVSVQKSLSIAAKEAGDFVQPKEVFRDYSEYKPLEISDEIRNDLKKLNELSKETDHEYGFAVCDGWKSKDFDTNHDHNNVTIFFPSDAKHVELYHSHADDSVLSRKDLKSVLDLRVDKETVSSLNGDVWQVDYTTGYRPTEDQLERVFKEFTIDAAKAVGSDPSFADWSIEEKDYMIGRELMYRVAHYYEWDVYGGHIDG